MSVTATRCAAGCHRSSGVFCVPDSGVLEDAFLWNSMGMHTCSVWLSNTHIRVDFPNRSCQILFVCVLCRHRRSISCEAHWFGSFVVICQSKKIKDLVPPWTQKPYLYLLPHPLHQFGLLLLLPPLKNMSLCCLCLEELSPSLKFDHASASASSWISCFRRCISWSNCTRSCSNRYRSCSNSNLRRISACLSVSGRPTWCSSPLSLPLLAPLSLSILFVCISETPGISLPSSADLLDYVIWQLRNATRGYLNSPMSHSCCLMRNKSLLIAALQCHCWCTQQCWRHCYHWALLKWSPTVISDRVDSVLGLITCQTTNLGWSWSSTERDVMW